MLSISTKRLENIICEMRKQFGKSPSFIVDAGGRIQRKVLREELINWVKQRGKGDRRKRMALKSI